VETGEADYAVLPIENTSSGSINEVFDVLQHTSLSIIGELTHPVEHALLVACDTDISKLKTLYAHPQVFSQCSHFLAELGNIEVKPTDSTSAAMLKVSEMQDPSIAAIGSAPGGALYGLTPIKSNLANQKENHSRFIVVARKP
ncbi:prephenate dehydratase domain-containing protein, partial [Bowmanella dokdonensis]